MQTLNDYQPPTADFMLQKQLRNKEERMLAFLYNVEHNIAAEKFDQKFAPFSELKIRQKNQTIQQDEVKRIFLALSEKLHQRIIRDNIEGDRALNKLESLWENKKIEYFHRYYVEKYLLTTHLDNIPTLIKHEDLLVRQEQHVYYSILRAIWAREACLNQISRQLKQLSVEDMHEHFHIVKQRSLQKNRKIQQKQYRVHGYRALFRLDHQEVGLGQTKIECLFDDINNSRKLTLHAIELITKWKEYICSLTHDQKKKKERIQYYYQYKNHLLFLLNDSSFIANSFLSNFYTFSARNDPFLLRPILILQKKQQQSEQLSFEQLQLKKLIQIRQIQLTNILISIQHLYNQLDTNIRNRKIISSFALNKIKSMSLFNAKTQQRQQNSPVKKIKLNPLPSQQSQLINSNKMGSKQASSSSLTKSNVIPRKSSQLLKPTTTFYSNPFNPETADPYKMIGSQKLQQIKLQVFKKVKQELQLQTKKTLLKSKHFQQLVDYEVNKNMNELLQQQRQQNNEAKLQVTPLSFREQEVGSYLAYIYKFIPIIYQELQPTQKQLTIILSELQYCYFLKIHLGNNQISHVLAKINRQIKQFKSIEVLLIAFKDPYMLQKIILKTVEFIWKYQNAKEVLFTFTYSQPQSSQLTQQLKEKLNNYCAVIEKRGKNHKKSHFLFDKKGQNQKFVYNPHPEKLHIKLYTILTTSQLKIDSQIEDQSHALYYEFILMENLRRFTNSEDFMILRDTFRPKDRFKHLLTHLLDRNKSNQPQHQLGYLEAENISALNNELTLIKKPHLELSDLIKINNLKMLMLELTLTPAYNLKVLSTLEGQKKHRYHIHKELDCFTDQHGTQFILLEVQESHSLKILLFKATHYLRSHKKSLYYYLNESMKRPFQKKYIENLWIDMLRYPNNPTEQNQLYLNTFKSDQFASINKELYVADELDWFTDIQIQNGLSYPLHLNDQQMTAPLGVGVINNTKHILYCRVLC